MFKLIIKLNNRFTYYGLDLASRVCYMEEYLPLYQLSRGLWMTEWTWHLLGHWHMPNLEGVRLP